MKRWSRRIALCVLALIVVAGTVAAIDFVRWRSADRRTPVMGASAVVATSRGPIEYAELGRGQPVLMIHGSPGGFDSFYSVLQRQYGDSGPPYRAIMPSRPGYLRTPLTTGRTPAEQADAMVALLDVLGVPRAAVFGLSDGGPSAVQFALRHNDRCSGLILVSAVTQRIGPEAIPAWYRFLNRILSAEQNAWLFSKGMAGFMEAEAKGDSAAYAEMMAMAASIKPTAPRVAGMRNDELQDREIGNWPIRDIKCPTLVIHGTADWMVPPFHGDSAAAIPGARLVRIDSAGHMAFITHRARVDAAIAAFLAAHRD